MARDYDGVNDEIDFGDIGALDGFVDLTVLTWIICDTLGDDEVFCFKHSSNTNGWGHQLSSSSRGGNNDVNVIMRNGANSLGYSTSNIVTTGSWHSSILVYDGGGSGDSGKLKLFFNNTDETLTFTTTIPSTGPSNASPVTTGAVLGGVVPLDGGISLVVCWTATLSPNELGALSRGVNPFPIRNSDQQLASPQDGLNSPEDNYAQTGTGTLAGTTKRATNPPVQLLSRYL